MGLCNILCKYQVRLVLSSTSSPTQHNYNQINDIYSKHSFKDIKTSMILSRRVDVKGFRVDSLGHLSSYYLHFRTIVQ